MTGIVEYVVHSTLFGHEPPSAGTYFATDSGRKTFLVSKVRRSYGSNGMSYRLIGIRVRSSDVPGGVDIRPWPRKPRGRSYAAQPATMPAHRPAAPIVTRAAAAAAERKRVLAIRRAHNDPNNQLVEPVRLATGSAVAADWRDPDDLSVHRRVARTIHGFRNQDPIDDLCAKGTFNRAQASAARRFRQLHELGEVGLKPAPNLLAAKVGFEPGGGPSESRLQWLEAYQRVCSALKQSNVAVLVAIVIRHERITDFAAARGLRPSLVSGMLLGAAQLLVDYFQELDDKQKRDEPRGVVEAVRA